MSCQDGTEPQTEAGFPLGLSRRALVKSEDTDLLTEQFCPKLLIR